ncbi:radical SAM protein [Dethiothermospora halolimnae]|uniref:radical SAM protein n=1 Tax=Dethiothermospora halolimnae TaxID=3114390 RepID=UPI003CCBE414
MDSYKHSRFNLVKTLSDNKIIIFNTLTQGMLEVEPDVYEKFKNIDTSDETITTKFKEYGFIVPSTINELDKLKFYNSKHRYSSKSLNVTIKTTNACNFLCKYCYQEHHRQDLSRDITEHLKKYFNKKIQSGVENIFIHWFGGEPLLNIDPILDIDNFLAKKDVAYRSSLTTNGYLLNEEYINKIKDTKIKNIQITLDGIRDNHNKTRVLVNGDGTFDKILSNIKNCIKIAPNINIVIRYNINKTNENFDDFLNFLENSDINTKNITLRVNQAQQHDISYTDEDIFYENTKEYSEKLLNVYKTMLKHGLNLPMYNVNGISCEFDCIDNFLIETDGKIYQCTSSNNEDSFYLGYIDEDGNVQFKEDHIVKKMLRSPFNKEKCVDCKLLPMCMGGCVYEEKHNRDECIPEKYIIDHLLELYYKANV